MNNETIVGQPVPRAEDPRLITGTGIFVDDIVRPGMLHAVVLRSSIAHGHILSIDTSAALEIEGVRAVITAADIGDDIPLIPLRLAPLPEFKNYLQPVIAKDKVRYVGEPIAVVVADTRAIAEDALDNINVDIEPLPVAPDRHAAVSGALLFEDSGTNRAVRYDVAFGDADAAFAAAEYTRRESFKCHRLAGLPMETRGLLAEWDENRLTVFGACKVLFFNRRILAPMLKVSESDIDMIEVDVGGGFGVRGEFYPEDFLIPFAARHVGQPVKWVEDRREHLMATNHSREVDCDIEIACKRDGTILGLRGSIYADMGAYIRTNGGVVPAKAAQFLPGPYRIPGIALTVEAVMTNKTPIGTYRAPGRFEGNFFRERLFDMVATDLKIDLMEFRLKNLITEAELPYATGKLVPYEPDTEFDTGDYPATFQQALDEIGWRENKTLQGKFIGGRYHGLAAVPFVESGGSGKENARVVVGEGGTIAVYVGSSILGQGLETTLTQVAADVLKIPFDDIKILHGSTTYLHEGFGTFASRSMVVGGSAVKAACENLVAAIQTVAKERLGFPNEQIEVAHGKVRAGNKEARLSDFAGVEADGTFATTIRTYSNGAHACHVAVDPETGKVDILDYVAIEDVGRIINPNIVHGQAIGALVQGLGGAFMEQVAYDQDGQILSVTLADYLVPTASDFQNIRAIATEKYRSKTNPLGAKGAGEGGMVAVAAAAANAVAAALAPLGVEVRELPLSPANIAKLIDAHRTVEDIAQTS
ncbi:xanthine dehydrogenase family protein molybdopterin-binding subunit [Pseudorhodoplanes sinuspersici]|uniref:Carbon monoxide dehydrogenase n=1 Tax=Pseudorhodoplanes sinuspersici TaxID=1235591 RepID=A0A1W7A017_9HYPH|nr:xanthine dehydrogenase family protein molybdopterin-binding subunit [Pseudorhodoplanes sinuspersici]ARQ02962.1 carbon monoxide dehydrogenase [Pseudorhodoplanes sinuspersici]